MQNDEADFQKHENCLVETWIHTCTEPLSRSGAASNFAYENFRTIRIFASSAVSCIFSEIISPMMSILHDSLEKDVIESFFTSSSILTWHSVLCTNNSP